MKTNLPLLLALALGLALPVPAQQTYTDTTGELSPSLGGPFPHLDIASVTVTASLATSQITFLIRLAGDPTNPNWGNYMVGVKSGSGGVTTGTGWAGRPISFPPGMTHWIGSWNTGGQVWTRGAAAWTQTSTFVPVKDAAQRTISLNLPFSALDITAGETLTFDVYSSGGGGTDSAVDALSAPETSITAWNQTFTSLEALNFAVPTASDTDGDGLPDAWETAHFPDLSQTPASDPDSDLLDNAGEYARGSNPTLPDTDGDGLTDKVEDNSALYQNPSAPGTSPVDNDTDDDTHPDGAEANGTALGYESNPLRKNFALFTVPGNFNSWNETGTATPPNVMGRAGDSLTAQYQHHLDHFFATPGQTLEFKIATGSWTDNWGGANGNAAFDGPNITATVIATGVHRFTFDQITLTYTFTRPTFADSAAFLAAYGLTASPDADPDGDGLTSAAEFTGNSDPFTADTDGDGSDDRSDTNPLGPGTAYDAWIAAAGVPAADQARGADPDHDGRHNLHEYLFGGNPLSGSDPAISLRHENASFVLVWLARANPAEATYLPEYNDSLAAAWVPMFTPSQEDAPDQSGVPDGYRRRQVAITPPGPAPWFRISAAAE